MKRVHYIDQLSHKPAASGNGKPYRSGRNRLAGTYLPGQT